MKKFLAILVVAVMLLSCVQPALAIDIPSVPIPVSPVSGSVLESFSPLQVSLVWAMVPGATHYNVVVSTVLDYSIPVFSAMTTANQQVTPYLNYGITYYWKVQAGNSAGTSSWSANQTLSFVPKAPTPISPTNGTHVIWGNSVYLNWQFVPYSGGTGYVVEVAYEPTFTSPLTTVGIITTDGYTFVPPTIGNYYWRARVLLYGPPGAVSPWSETRFFSVFLPPLTAPNPMNPNYNELIMSNEVSLQWAAVPFASYYQVQARGTNIDQVTYHNSYSIFLTSGQNYSWRVRAGNAYGWGPWSDWIPFRCLLVPGAVNLTAPINDTPFKKLGAVLTWQSVENATTYKIQLTDGLTNQMWNLISTTDFVFVETQFNHWYSWKVSAINEAGQGPWSSIWHFSVLDTVLPDLSVNALPEWTNKTSLIVSGRATDNESGIAKVAVNGIEVALSSDGSFNYNLAISEGINTITVVVYDRVGNFATKQLVVKRDTTSPMITISSPLYLQATVIEDIPIKGKILDAGGVRSLTINNSEVLVGNDGSFTWQSTLNYGPNQVYIKAVDFSGNTAYLTLSIEKTPKTINVSFQVGNPLMYVITGDSAIYEEIDPGRGTTPIIRNDRMFIPIRALVSALKGNVSWDSRSQKITIDMPKPDSLLPLPGKHIHIELWIGKAEALITNASGYSYRVEIEPGNKKVVPFIANGRSYFPLRFIVERFGIPSKDVEWIEELQTVRITYSLIP
jgi:hypothetical protein